LCRSCSSRASDVIMTFAAMSPQLHVSAASTDARVPSRQISSKSYITEINLSVYPDKGLNSGLNSSSHCLVDCSVRDVLSQCNNLRNWDMKNKLYVVDRRTAVIWLKCRWLDLFRFTAATEKSKITKVDLFSYGMPGLLEISQVHRVTGSSNWKACIYDLKLDWAVPVKRLAN